MFNKKWSLKKSCLIILTVIFLFLFLNLMATKYSLGEKLNDFFEKNPGQEEAIIMGFAFVAFFVTYLWVNKKQDKKIDEKLRKISKMEDLETSKKNKRRVE